MGYVFAILMFALLLVRLPSSHDESTRRESARVPAPAAIASAPQRKASSPQDSAAAGGALLAGKRLVMPVQGFPRARLRDTFDEARGTNRTHKALDIMAPWGTPVLAADDGRLAKISRNRAGGLAAYQVDASGQFVYYYAHLAGYADDLKEGQWLARGDVIGYVGTTGNAPDSAPHLHFAVQLTTQQGRWWKGQPINPYQALSRADARELRPPEAQHQAAAALGPASQPLRQLLHGQAGR